jgi:hypothetical protein
MTPEAGRNNTLYLTVYEIAYTTEEVDYEAALSFGEEINSSFGVPLGKSEVEKTVRSAFEHGIRARKKKVREKRKLVTALEDEKEEEREQSKKEVAALITEAIIGKEQIVPDSFLEISDILVSNIWSRCKNKEQIANHNILASAYKTRYYKKLTDFLMGELKRCGAFKVNGYSVYLRGVNDSGEVVRYRRSLDSEALASLLQDILSRLYLNLVKVSLNGKEGGEVKGESLLSHLEGEGNNGSKEKTKKDKTKGSAKVHRDKANGGSGAKENAT